MAADKVRYDYPNTISYTVSRFAENPFAWVICVIAIVVLVVGGFFTLYGLAGGQFEKAHYVQGH
jgi:hypothetical protein